jgi:Protein of unknown function (DUF3237)
MDKAAASPGAPGGMPALTLAFDLWVALEPEVGHGRTPLGLRTRAPIIGGQFSGPDIAGEVLGGGSDWQLLRADGWLELRAEYDLRVRDGTLVHVRNHGLWHSPDGNWPADYAMSTPRFEAPLGPHAWLNQHVFIAEVRPSTHHACGVDLRVWRVTPPRRAAG